MENDFFDSLIVGNCYKWSNTTIREMAGQAPDGNSFYHYTSTKVLNSLLETGTFWASHLFFLNDSKEYVGGVKFLEELLKENSKIEKILKDVEIATPSIWSGIYSISFSKIGDSLQQWVTYAKEGGVSIELETFPKLMLLIAKDEKRGVLSQDIYHPFEDVYHSIYYEPSCMSKSKANLLKIITNGFEQEFGGDNHPWEEFEEHAKVYLQLLSSYIKTEDFNGEDEIRLSFFASKSQADCSITKTDINYYEMPDGILRPYINVKFCRETDISKGKTFKKVKASLPIKSIMIGPSGKQQRVFDSVVHRVKYGTLNVWNCTADVLKKRFNQYVNGSIERLLEDNKFTSISKELKSKIKIELLSQWENETGKKMSLKKNKKELEYEDEKKNTKKALNLTELSVEESKLLEIVTEINKSNYFSKEGIWIKKSKIPYIF